MCSLAKAHACDVRILSSQVPRFSQTKSFADGNPASEDVTVSVPEGVQLIVHNPYQKDELSEVGVTSHRTRVLLNKNFTQAGFRILTGKIGLHAYAGYSGGRQVILAVSGIQTLHDNYNLIIFFFIAVLL